MTVFFRTYQYERRLRARGDLPEERIRALVDAFFETEITDYATQYLAGGVEDLSPRLRRGVPRE